MGHDKTRSSVTVGSVDWNDPRLSDLLQKVGDWNIEQRNQQSVHEVQIRLAGAWNAGAVSKPAVLISEADETLVLATRFPLPHGEEVQVIDTGPAARTRWAVVIQEREGHRAGDRELGLNLSWLRIRTR